MSKKKKKKWLAWVHEERAFQKALVMFAPPLSECFLCHFLPEASAPLCSVKEKVLCGMTPMCQSPPEQAEWDGFPHRADNVPALCPDKGAHPGLTSHAVSSDMERLSLVAQPSSHPARSGNICDSGTKSTSQVSIRKTLRSSETHVTKPTGSKLLILK